MWIGERKIDKAAKFTAAETKQVINWKKYVTDIYLAILTPGIRKQLYR